MNKPLYSIGTWDSDLQAYTPQNGVPAFNLTRCQLVQSIRMLKDRGYSCHRYGNTDIDAFGLRDSDTYVLIERTDGLSEEEILSRWKR